MILLGVHIVGHFPKPILLVASSAKTPLHDRFLGSIGSEIKLAEDGFKILDLLLGFL
jgi:hypothetical protein